MPEYANHRVKADEQASRSHRLPLSSLATLSILTPDERYPPPKQHLEYDHSHQPPYQHSYTNPPISNINLPVRAFYDLAPGCRGDALVPRRRTASSKIFALPTPMRGNLLRAPDTKCSWPHSLSDRLGGVSKTNACAISAPL